MVVSSICSVVNSWNRFLVVYVTFGICFCCTICTAAKPSQPHSTQQQPAVVIDNINDYHDITILGLGSMGQAFVKCLIKSNNTTKVHGWNRGAEKRDAVRDMGATTYDTAEDAVRASNITLILIDDWDGIVQLIANDMKRDVWSGKVVVLFSTYTPTDIIKLQNDYFISDATTVLVGGAIVAEPHTVCSPNALVLLSSNIPQIESIGRVVVFNGNVGYATLVNMALILVITFGIAGQELALLILRQYGATGNEFYDTYLSLSKEIGPNYTRMLLPIVSNSILTKEYEKTYVPVGTFRNVLLMQTTFMKEIGIADDTFVVSYLNYLTKVTNMKYGPAAWIEEAVVVVDDVNQRNSDSTINTLDEKIKDQEL